VQRAARRLVAPGATVRGASSPFVLVTDWLPKNPVRDGSIDYTVQVQSAIDAAAATTLILPDFPLRVSKRANALHCLLVRTVDRDPRHEQLGARREPRRRARSCASRARRACASRASR
jgi:hypothetical protein